MSGLIWEAIYFFFNFVRSHNCNITPLQEYIRIFQCVPLSRDYNLKELITMRRRVQSTQTLAEIQSRNECYLYAFPHLERNIHGTLRYASGRHHSSHQHVRHLHDILVQNLRV